MRYTQRPLKWSYIQIYINKTYYDASWVRTTVATIIKSMLVKILLFSSLEKSFSAVVTAGRRFPDLYPEFSGLLVDTHLPSTQIYKFLPFSKIFGIFQLLKFPPKRLFVPDCRTAAAIRFRLSSTLPSRKSEGTMYDTTFRNKEPGTSCLQDSLLVSSSFICCSALWSILSPCRYPSAINSHLQVSPFFQNIWNLSTAKISPQTALCPRLPNGRVDSLSSIVYASFTRQLSRVT